MLFEFLLDTPSFDIIADFIVEHPFKIRDFPSEE
jgi:hypothetical protein